MISSPETGVGCDIEEIERFSLDRIKDARFLERVFTHTELDYCFSFQYPAPHLAARFCGKEAVVKALCSIGRGPIDYKRIEIVNQPSGVPFVTIWPDEESNIDTGHEIRLSLSHCKTTAMAIAIIVRRPPINSSDTSR